MALQSVKLILSRGSSCPIIDRKSSRLISQSDFCLIPMDQKPKLLDQMRQVLRTGHYSLRTERSYVDWASRYILFHQKRHPLTLREAEVAQFLTHFAPVQTHTLAVVMRAFVCWKAVARFQIAPLPGPLPRRQELVSTIFYWPRGRGKIWIGQGTQGGGRGVTTVTRSLDLGYPI